MRYAGVHLDIDVHLDSDVTGQWLLVKGTLTQEKGYRWC